MKVYLKNIIIFLVQLLEKYEFKNIKTDETDPLKKIIDIIPINKLVKTDYGNTPATEIVRTIPLQRYELLLENGNRIECADTHIVYCKNHTPKTILNLSINDEVITKNGLSRVKKVKKLFGKMSMFDLTINGPEPSYYTNNILSHNTVSAAIVLLHFVLFNNDKGVMIVANKGKTVIEIIRKIKDIYKLLPFHLKKGVINWNEKSIAFENGSRIQSENRTKEPSIGFTIDFLYLDEFAKVPKSIVESYYGAVVPTVSAINNSKIVITSTPDGFNLFHKLLIDAERDMEDPLKNMYESMRVYWHQVKGRMDSKILPLVYKLKEHKIKKEDLLKHLEKLGYNLTEKEENKRTYYYIKWDSENETTDISSIRNIRIGNNIPLDELCVITNWKEDETKLIGGENMFNQEYDLQFVTGDKLLFDTDQMTKFKTDSADFKYVQFNKLDRALTTPYTPLKWITGRPDLFTPEKMKDYHIVAAVDLGEGLGQDYSVLNIFRLLPKPKEVIERTHKKLSGMYDYFYLEQIAMCRVNNWSITEFAELFYMVMFELFDPEKSKVVLEYNTYGATFISELSKIFEGEHNYSSGIFLRYKHRKEDKVLKIGMKITGGENEASKKILVKSLQSAVKKQLIRLHNDININEISTFTKKETHGGNFTYRCDSGHDDTVMTLVSLSSVFSHVQYKNMIEDYINTKLTTYEKNLIDKYDNQKTDDKVDYNGTKKNYNKVYKKSNGFGRSPGLSGKNNSPIKKSSPWG